QIGELRVLRGDGVGDLAPVPRPGASLAARQTAQQLGEERVRSEGLREEARAELFVAAPEPLLRGEVVLVAGVVRRLEFPPPIFARDGQRRLDPGGALAQHLVDARAVLADEALGGEGLREDLGGELREQLTWIPRAAAADGGRGAHAA